MKIIHTAAAAVFSVIALGQTARAAELGDKAPPLQIAEWVKGKPVDLAAGKDKTVYVVEFWATWCPPCRTSIPHLTEMQKKFKDRGVVFIGVSDEKPDTVKKFVEKMGDKMDYVVAVDQDRKTSEGYMEAFGINGIPHAFIVDKQGRIVWNGHPMADLDKTLDELLAGKFDLEKVKKRAGAQKKVEEFFELASQGGDEAKLDTLAKELVALDKEIGGIQPGQKFDPEQIRNMAKFRKAMTEYQQAIEEGKDAAELEKLSKAAEAVAPKDFNFASFKESMSLQRLFTTYCESVGEGGDKEKAAELSRKLAATKAKNPQMLNLFAWTLLTDEKIKQRDLPLATQLAKAAVDASDGKDSAVLDTYARALFDSGKVSEAVAEQKKAVALCDDGEMRKELEATLKRYQAKPTVK